MKCMKASQVSQNSRAVARGGGGGGGGGGSGGSAEPPLQINDIYALEKNEGRNV